MKVSKHAKKRLKERTGLPKRAHLRHVKSVLQYGKLMTNSTADKLKMTYNSFLYIFARLKDNQLILVTAYPLEKYFHESIKF